MKYVFIVNQPAVRKSLRFVPLIENYFKNSEEYEIIYTEYPKHATEIARYTEKMM